MLPYFSNIFLFIYTVCILELNRMNNSEVGKAKSSKIRRMNVASSKMLTGMLVTTFKYLHIYLTVTIFKIHFPIYLDGDSNDGCERCKNLEKLFSEKIDKLTGISIVICMHIRFH